MGSAFTRGGLCVESNADGLGVDKMGVCEYSGGDDAMFKGDEAEASTELGAFVQDDGGFDK